MVNPIINLPSLDGSNGFRLDGENSYDFFQGSVSDAGDVNGDGFDDVIVSAPYADPNGPGSGSSYVVFGQASGFDAAMDLSSLDGSNGFRLDGENSRDFSGWSVSDAGDVNGDGFADVIIGVHFSHQDGNGPDLSYVVFGRASAFDAAIDLSSLDGSNGFRLQGEYGSFNSSSRSVSGAGDVNGDGFDDVIVEASYADQNGHYLSPSYVVFGKASGFDAAIDLLSLDGNNGFRLTDTIDFGRTSVKSANDIDGDGFDDLLVTIDTSYDVPYSHSFVNFENYVVFGKASGFDAVLDSSSLDADNSLHLETGVASVSNAGDINGDGYDDLIFSDGYGVHSPVGRYVVFGQASGVDANVDLANLDGSNGFRLNVGLYPGTEIKSAGDVNGDGFDDLIIGTTGTATYSGGDGYSHVLFGQASGFGASVDLPNLDNDESILLDGVRGQAVSSAGDVNGDGFDDLLAGAYRVSPNGDYFGASYVIFGSDHLTGAPTFLGTEGDDEFNGTVALEYFRGGDGNDILSGGGGADVFNGDAGGDTIRVPDLNFQKVNGGDGHDTLELTGSNIDLNRTGLLARIEDIETIDLTGSGDNTLTLTAQDVLDLSETSNKLRVKGDAGDRVVGLSQGWTDAGMEGNFHVFAKRGAELLIDASVGTDPLITLGVINLSTLDGTNGFRLDGEKQFDGSGRSVSSAGDVNGDGLDDVIVGAMDASPNGTESGSSYVVFGRASGFNAIMDLSSLDGNNGFRLDGVAQFDESGRSVSNAGDVNGDGFDDVIIGATRADPHGYESGSSYVVFGKTSGFTATMGLSSLDGSNGFRLDGATASEYSGSSVSNAGDVNGDGFADLIVGDKYVVFGKASGFDAAMNLSSLDGSNGFRLDGVAGGLYSGNSASGAGDVNGDGFDDVIIGSAFYGPDGNGSGASYVVFGKASGFSAVLNLSSLDGSNGFRVDGAAYDYSGASVSNAGDVNGDGFADVIIGASFADLNGHSSGTSYVVFGKASGFDAALELTSLDGNNGFQLVGTYAGDQFGHSVSGAGDVNGDGFDDVIIGGSKYSYDPDSSYVVFGKSTGFGATVDVSSLDGSNGIRLKGVEGDRSGFSVSSAGDVNGDGFDDLLVGAFGASPNGDASGSSYVIFGRSDFGGSGEVKVIQGTPGNDNLKGTPAAEVFEAGDGNDQMIGRGGADVFHGDAGDDYIQVTDLGFALVDGGSGEDMLHTDGKDLNLDLTNFGDKIHGIETICLYGRGDNELTLTAANLISLSDTDNTLRVNGNAGDHVTVLDDGWVDEGNRGSGYYHVYTNDDAVLLVGMNVTIDFA